MNKALFSLSLLSLPFLGTAQEVLNEGFSSGIPSTWEVKTTNSSYTWAVNDTVVPNNNVAIVRVDRTDNSAQQDETLITPSISIPTTADYYFLKFQSYISYSSAVTADTYTVYVKISEDGGTTWKQLWTEADKGTFGEYEGFGVNIDLTEYKGKDVKVAFQYVGLRGADWAIDNVKVEGLAQIPQLPKCVNIETPLDGATGIGIEDNEFIWEDATVVNPADDVYGYNVYVGYDVSNLQSLGIVNTNFTALPNMDYSSTYYWKVAPVNAVGEAQNCSSQSFTTEVPPPAPDCTNLITPADNSTDYSVTEGIFEWEVPAVSENYGEATSYKFYLSKEKDNPNYIGETDQTSYAMVDLDGNTEYFWSVVPVNAGGEAQACVEYSFTTGENPFLPYCGPLGTQVIVPISLVKFAGINNETSAEVDGSRSHQIFLDQVASVRQGESYDITIKGNTVGRPFLKLLMFADWNQNGTFESSEMITLPDLPTSTGTDDVSVTASITIPSDAKIGKTRMRIKYAANLTPNLTDPCGYYSHGQLEDYTMDISEKLATDEVTANKSIFVSPNPVDSVMNIISPYKVTGVTIYDATGKSVYNNLQMNEMNPYIKVSHLVKGVYIVSVKTEKGLEQIKIVKK